MKKGNPEVPLRIGIHLGDIVYNETEVYGDGVNYASRIESLGIKGAILLSKKVNDELKNHKEISTIFLGNFNLKNISEPAKIYCITNEGITVPSPTQIINSEKNEENTIAVLPFVNMSSSKENEYFCDGITEEIINALAKIEGLKVTSRTSSFFFKDKNISISLIGEKLNVSTILEGSIRLSGNKMRITAQLIEVKNDFHYWSETWDRKLDNIFELQDEISLLIADKIREHSGHIQIQDHLVEKQTDNLDTYDYFLKGKYHFRKWNPTDVQLAISYYNKAIAIDPEHAESYLGLSDAYGFLATTGFLAYEDAWKKAIEYANIALSINNNLAELYYQLANIKFFVESDYSASFENATKAIEIKQNNVEAHQFLSFLYIIAGNQKKSLEHLQIALTIDPLSQETLFYSAFYNFMIKDYSKANKQLDSCIQQNPKNIPAHSVKCYILIDEGKIDEAINYYDHKMQKEIVILEDKIGITALALTKNNEYEKAKNLLNKLIKEFNNTPTAKIFYYFFYAIKGESKNALSWAESLLKTNYSLLLLHFNNPLATSVKKDPYYEKFKSKLYPISKLCTKKKNKKKLLDQKTIRTYKNKLLDFIKLEKPYLDPKLSLRSLAEMINIHPNQLSWLLNESIGKNFTDFINHYRIETFKELATEPKNAHISLIGLAYDSGFNSKTAFNTYFKKEVGLTPKEFLKNLQ